MTEAEGEQLFEIDEYISFEKNGRHWDPSRVWRLLMNHPEVDVSSEMDRMARPATPDDVHEAMEQIVRAAIPAFGLQPFDSETGTGTTEAEAFLLCRDFLRWVVEFKKKLLLLPTRWQLMGHTEPSADPSESSSDGPAPSITAAC